MMVRKTRRSGGATVVAGTASVVFVLALMSANSAVMADEVLSYTFETVNGVPVTHQQNADPSSDADDTVDNDGTAPFDGDAHGSDAGFSPAENYLYKQHSIPAAIDPGGVAGTYAFYIPEDSRAGINTELPSNGQDMSYDLSAATTVEGYFYSQQTELRQQHLYHDKRGDLSLSGNKEIRFGIEIDRYLPPVTVVDGLIVYEPFDYTGTAIDGKNGGIGWAQPWQDIDGDFALLSDDDVSMDSAAFPFTPVGDRVDNTNGAGVNDTRLAIRNMGWPFDLSKDGNVLYLSALVQRTPVGDQSGSDLQIRLYYSDANGEPDSSRARLFISSDGAWGVQAGSDTTSYAASGGAPVAGEVYFVVMRVNAGQTEDTALFKAYGPGDTVPVTEPAEVDWDLKDVGSNSDAILEWVQLRFGKNNAGEIDELRIGSTWESVTDPNAPIGSVTVPTERNTLRVIYHDNGDTYEAYDGVNEILPNTWYHIAGVYDDANDTIKAYLNGSEVISVSNVNLTAPGVGSISIGNRRPEGKESSEGFWGMIDEVRVYDEVLAPADFMTSGSKHTSGLVWASSFETHSSGTPVPNDNFVALTGPGIDDSAIGNLIRKAFVSSIDNEADPSYASRGYAIVPPQQQYLQYGTAGIPAIPAALIKDTVDPGSFAFYNPPSLEAKIDTNIPSNIDLNGDTVPDLQDELTFEGYFNLFAAGPTGESAVGLRLVTLKGSSDSSQRITIGLSQYPTDSTPSGNVLALRYRESSASGGANVLVLEDAPVLIEQGQWHHFACTFDGTYLRAFLDGVLRIEKDTAGDLYTIGSDNLTVVNNRSDESDSDRAWYGLVDLIKVHDRVLTPGEFMVPSLCNMPFADLDGDKDVDMDDFAQLQKCLTLGGGAVAEECECLDRPGAGSGDNDVDADDVDAFLDCATGSGIPWSAAATPDCEP